MDFSLYLPLIEFTKQTATAANETSEQRTIKKLHEPGMVAHTFHLRTQEAEAGKSLSLRSALSTELVSE